MKSLMLEDFFSPHSSAEKGKVSEVQCVQKRIIFCHHNFSEANHKPVCKSNKGVVEVEDIKIKNLY